jgi:DNA-binding CsgD family transcriptional regulator
MDGQVGACAALRFLTDQLGYGVLIASPDGALLHSNAAAAELLSGDSPFSVSNRLLSVQGTVCTQWVEQLPPGPQFFRCAVIKHRSTEDNKFDADYRVAVTYGALKRAGDPMVMCVYSSLLRRKVEPEILRALYGLTPAEADVAIGVYDGHSLSDLARDRATSIHTVRTQLKRVMNKCQVRSQLELCQLLTSGPGVF